MPVAPVWRSRGKKPWHLKAKAPLDIDGVTVAGLHIEMTADQNLPFENVSVALSFEPPTGTVKGGHIYRIDWRPLNAHTNKEQGQYPGRLRTFVGSHQHPLNLNERHCSAQLKNGGLPIATHLPRWFRDDYRGLLVLASRRLRITGLETVELPPWNTSLNLL